MGAGWAFSALKLSVDSDIFLCFLPLRLQFLMDLKPETRQYGYISFADGVCRLWPK